MPFLTRVEMDVVAVVKLVLGRGTSAENHVGSIEVHGHADMGIHIFKEKSG
jgi:hypothetical protein